MIKQHYPGSSIVAFLTITGLMLALLGTVFSLSFLTTAQATREQNLRKAITLGNGALNHAIAKYRSDSNYRSESYALTTGAVDIALTNNESNSLTVNAQTYVPYKQHSLAVCRSYQVDIDPITGDTIAGSYDESFACNKIPTDPTNTPPTLSIELPDSKGARAVAGQTYTVSYLLTDSQVDDVLTARFYYTPQNTSSSSKVEITGSCSIPLPGVPGSCNWLIPANITPGDYYIYGEATDNVNPTVSAFSLGKLTILPVGTPAFTITRPANETPDIVTSTAGSSYSITYQLSDDYDGNTGQTVTANLFYDTDTNSSNGTSGSVSGCQGIPEGNLSCNWATAGVPNGTYFIYGQTNGAQNNTSTYSVGKVTVTNNTAPQLSVTQPAGTPTVPSAQKTVTITFNLSDDDPVKVSFYYDKDAYNYNGTLISGCTDVSIQGQNQTCSWDVSQLPLGDYWVYGVVTGDTYGRTTRAYAPGFVRISSVDAGTNAIATLAIHDPDGINDTVNQETNCCASYQIRYSLNDPEETVTAAFYYATTATTTGGTAITTSNCAAAPEGTFSSCLWRIPTNLSPGKYYIYGITTDVPNPADPNYNARLVKTLAPEPVIVAGILPACRDGRDNDGDGLTDYPADKGCVSLDDSSEIDPPFNDYGTGVATDSSGDVYMAGYSDNYGLSNVFIRKYSKTGQFCANASCYQSTTPWGDNGTSMIKITLPSTRLTKPTIAVDGNKNLFVAMAVGANSNASPYVMVYKYASNGTRVQTFGSNGSLTAPLNVGALRLRIDSNNNIYMLAKEDRSYDSRWFISKYSNNGVLCNTSTGPCGAWGTNGSGSISKDSNAPSQYAPSDIVIDTQGNLYLGGTAFTSNPQQGTMNGFWHLRKYTATGILDTSFDGDGIVTYEKQVTVYRTGVGFDGNGNPVPYQEELYTRNWAGLNALAVDATGNIYAGGAQVWEGGPYTQWVIRKYNGQGQLCSSTSNCAWGENGRSGMTTYNHLLYGYDSDFVTGLTVTNTNQLIAIGYTDYSNATVRAYTSAGDVNTSFNTDGTYGPFTNDQRQYDHVALTGTGTIVAIGNLQREYTKGMDALITTLTLSSNPLTGEAYYDSTP
ncbi:MAG TPA: SBBP repeat-containing protein [Patescibacteria group bacterium]